MHTVLLCEPTSAICSNCAWKSERQTNVWSVNLLSFCQTVVEPARKAEEVSEGLNKVSARLFFFENVFWVIYMYMYRIASTEKWLMWQHCLSLLTWQPCCRRPQVPTHTCTPTVCQRYVSVRSKGPSALCVCVVVRLNIYRWWRAAFWLLSSGPGSNSSGWPSAHPAPGYKQLPHDTLHSGHV